MIADWLTIALQKTILLRAIKIALIVGTILMIINHGDVMLSDGLSIKEYTKIILTYLVPYCVSTYSSSEAVCAAENLPSIHTLLDAHIKQKSLKLAQAAQTTKTGLGRLILRMKQEMNDKSS